MWKCGKRKTGEPRRLRPPPAPTEASIAGEEVVPPGPPDAAAEPVSLAAPPRAFRPAEPRAIAPPVTKAPLEMRSPPDRAGEPPRTAAKSFGICQHSIMKMIEAPMISRADIAGLELEAMFWAEDIQSTERFMPVPIRR